MMKKRLYNAKGVYSFPHYWQEPAATEKAAYESVVVNTDLREFDYVGIPWATIIDGLRGGSHKVSKILFALGEVPENKGRRRVSVAQHIHAMHFPELFKAAGITDLFWSHNLVGQTSLFGIKMHPFPLFPAQIPKDGCETGNHLQRKYLANFIGAYNPNIYLTNVRKIIFDSAGVHSDLLIIKRDGWHFDRIVYEEQVHGLNPGEEILKKEIEQKQEYLEAIKNSWFTLCPTGSGPNSIRIFESLALGSIPIILSKELMLAGPEELWMKAAIIEDDSEDGYNTAMQKAREINLNERLDMVRSGQELYRHVSPSGYFNIINKI